VSIEEVAAIAAAIHASRSHGHTATPSVASAWKSRARIDGLRA
jgi:hypothetical protein